MLKPAQKKKLVEAVLLAKGPGECNYVINGRPGCVIGQLGAICGAKVSDLCFWDDCEAWEVHSGSTGVESLLMYVDPVALRDYPARLLAQLQCIWDYKGDARSEDEKRLGMLFEIEAWDE